MLRARPTFCGAGVWASADEATNVKTGTRQVTRRIGVLLPGYTCRVDRELCSKSDDTSTASRRRESFRRAVLGSGESRQRAVDQNGGRPPRTFTRAFQTASDVAVIDARRKRDYRG